MNKCLIITSYVERINSIEINNQDYDCVICADGGLIVANKLNISADILIGDYDSMTQPHNKDLIKLPTEKDMTDTEAALDLAVSKGFTSIDILGGLGGRFDHTMGNIGLLAKYSGKLSHLALIDGQNYVYIITPPGATILKMSYKYLGLISYSNEVSNLTLRGTKYPLTNHKLTNNTTLGVSNEISDENCQVSFDEGLLMVILSKDIDK